MKTYCKWCLTGFPLFVYFIGYVFWEVLGYKEIVFTTIKLLNKS